MNTRLFEISVGIIVFTAGIIILAIFINIMNLSLFGEDDSYTLIAYFDNVGGLQVRSPVAIGGFNIGRVSRLEYDQADLSTVVSMKINSKYGVIPKDSRANIYAAGLLGEQYISLDIGKSKEILGDGGVITKTEGPMILEEKIAEALYKKAAGDGLSASTPSSKDPFGAAP